jgi:hypothetical protein
MEVVLCGMACYGCSRAVRPLADKWTAMRVARKKTKEAAKLRAMVAAREPAPHALAVAALWRFAHLLLARARGAHDGAARAAALRLAMSDDVPLDAMRAIGEAFRAEVAARNLTLRTPTLRERALAKIQLPSLRSDSGGEEGAASSDRRKLARDTFYALGALALTSRRVRRCACACGELVSGITDVLWWRLLPSSCTVMLARRRRRLLRRCWTAPPRARSRASARWWRRASSASRMRSQHVRRSGSVARTLGFFALFCIICGDGLTLALFTPAEHARTLREVEEEAEEATCKAERARKRAASGRGGGGEVQQGAAAGAAPRAQDVGAVELRMITDDESPPPTPRQSARGAAVPPPQK